MMRLFVALDLPPSVKSRLGDLCAGVPGARWVAPASLHLTLRFIGEVDQPTLEDIDGALDQITAPAFALSLAGVGEFASGGRSRMLWAGVERSEPLERLQAKVAAALLRAGVPGDDRKFNAHVTLARLKAAPRERVARFIVEHSLLRLGPVAIDRFLLYRSHLARGGSIYEPLRAYELDRLEA